MRNIIAYAAIIFGIVPSLTTAEYSGSSNSRDDGYDKSGFDSSYNDGFVGEYAGQLGAGKALGELHDYGASEHASQQYDEGKHGSEQYEEGESHSHYSDSYGQQGDGGGHKFSNNNFDRFSANLDLSKFPIDVEAEHYTGGGLPDIGLGDEDQQQEQHQQYEGHHDYQSDDEGDQTAKQHSAQYNSYEETAKSPDYNRYQDHVSMHIVPYSGYQEAEQEQHVEQPEISSGYEKSQQSNEAAKDSKAPSETYSQSYESPKAPSDSYSQSYEAPKAPSETYSQSYESPKAPSETYSQSYESPKAPSSSYSSSYETQKEPTPTYSPSYESVKASYESHGGKFQYSSSPSKSSDYVHQVKAAGLKNFHASMPKNVMTISHGKGGFSYSSLYRA